MGAASKLETESCGEAGVERTTRSSSVVEICSVCVTHQPSATGQVVMILEQRERRSPQAPIRVVRSHRREMSPAAARILAQLLVQAADRAEAAHG